MEMLYIGLGLSSIVVGSGLALGLLFKSSKGVEESAPSNITITNCGNTTIDNTKELNTLQKENIELLEKLNRLEEAQQNLKDIFTEELDRKAIDNDLKKYSDLINKYSNAIVVEKEVEIIKEVNNTTPIEEMYCINMHGFSVNKQYDYTPIGARKTKEYIQWQKEFMARFNELGIKDEILLELNPNKKIKAEYSFVKYHKNDVDNFAKSLTDTLVKCLGLEDDNNFESVHLSVVENVIDKRLGKIYFKLSNIE
jgi:Holliday junction resolvase RusA-like endonuclease